MNPVRSVRAVRDHVDGVLTARALDPSEALTLGRPDAAARVPQYLALRHLLQTLLDDADALQALRDANPVRGFDVAGRIGYDLELQLGVDTVRIVDPDVEVHARAAKSRARYAHLDRLLLRHLPDVARAGDEDLVALDQVYEIPLEVGLQTLDIIPDLLR